MKRQINTQQTTDFTGRLLAASPLIDANSYFYKSVIYIVQSNAKGTVGILVNQPIISTDTTFYVKTNEPHGKKLLSLNDVNTYLGGPVDISKALILHSDDTGMDSDKIEISSDLQILKNIVNGTGPRMSLLALGYCSWSPGQLEQEIKDHHWFVLPPNNQTVFEIENEDKWSYALESLHINQHNFSITPGNC